MSNVNIARPRLAAGILSILALTCFGLTACGGSSGSSTKTTTTSAPKIAGATSTGAATTPSTTTSTSNPTSTPRPTARTQGAPGAAGVGQRAQVFRHALTKYAVCLRQNGVNMPAPNTSGKGPIFSTKGINTSSPQFRAATMKCRATLIGAFQRPRAANGTGSTGTSPPAGG